MIALSFYNQISFKLTNLQTLLKLYLLKTKTDLLIYYLEILIDVIICLHPIEKHLFGNEVPFHWSSKLLEAMRLTWGSVFFFLKIDLSFATLQAFGKTPYEIERLQCSNMGFANMLAPSFKNLPESLSTPASLELSIFIIIFYTFSSEILFMQISFEIVKLQ